MYRHHGWIPQETLQFAARLRMGSEFTEREREERVARVAELLGLDVCVHSICGDALTRGISGGQVRTQGSVGYRALTGCCVDPRWMGSQRTDPRLC